MKFSVSDLQNTVKHPKVKTFNIHINILRHKKEIQSTSGSDPEGGIIHKILKVI